jgi:hypothetical protein
MQRQEKQEDFLSLTAAAVLVYNHATGDITDDPGLLQEVARCIASHAQLHGKSPYSQEFRPIPRAALHASVFEDAAHRLIASNGTCDYSDLSIALADFERILPTVAALCRTAEYRE